MGPFWDPKNDPFLAKTREKPLIELARRGPKMDPKMAQNGSFWAPFWDPYFGPCQVRLAPQAGFGPFWPKVAKKGPKRGPNMGQNRPKSMVFGPGRLIRGSFRGFGPLEALLGPLVPRRPRYGQKGFKNDRNLRFKEKGQP